MILNEADGGVEQAHGHDHGGVGPVAEGGGDLRRDQQNLDQQVVELTA